RWESVRNRDHGLRCPVFRPDVVSLFLGCCNHRVETFEFVEVFGEALSELAGAGLVMSMDHHRDRCFPSWEFQEVWRRSRTIGDNERLGLAGGNELFQPCTSPCPKVCEPLHLIAVACEQEQTHPRTCFWLVRPYEITETVNGEVTLAVLLSPHITDLAMHTPVDVVLVSIRALAVLPEIVNVQDSGAILSPSLELDVVALG